MQDNVRVTIIKRSHSLFRPAHYMEFLDPPYLQTRTSSRPLPCTFLVPSLFSHMSFQLVRTEFQRPRSNNKRKLQVLHLNLEEQCSSP